MEALQLKLQWLGPFELVTVSVCVLHSDMPGGRSCFTLNGNLLG